MTFKILKTTESLPKHNYNLAKAMRENGYSRSSAYSGAVRKSILNYTKTLDFFSPERIKKDIANNRKKADKLNKVAVVDSIDQHRSKIAGMIVDKQEHINPEKLVIIDRTIQPVVDSDKKE